VVRSSGVVLVLGEPSERSSSSSAKSKEWGEDENEDGDEDESIHRKAKPIELDLLSVSDADLPCLPRWVASVYCVIVYDGVSGNEGGCP
jgi:hypothetical protein